MSQMQPTPQAEFENQESPDQLQPASIDANMPSSDDLSEEQLDEMSGGLRSITAPRMERVQ